MLIVESRKTQAKYYALQWTGKNKAEFRQFGRTGHKAHTKISCIGQGMVWECGAWNIIGHDYYVVLTDCEPHRFQSYSPQEFKATYIKLTEDE